MRQTLSSIAQKVRTKALLLAALLLVAAQPLETSQSASPRFPPRLQEYFRNTVKLTPGEEKLLAGGQPMTRLLNADANKEVAVLGAIWINAPARRYVDAVMDIEAFERGGGFKVTKKISSPPRIEDFAQLQLPRDDVNDLRTCRVGSCEVKLGEQSLNRFRTQIDWTAPDAATAANQLMRRIALERVQGYLEGGNERLAVYRDRGRPTFVAQEFRSMVDSMPELTTYLPNIRRYLLDYPKGSLAGVTDFLYWQETEFGLKPTIRINHMTLREGPDDIVIASKMLYATHYFWTGLELRALVLDPARGPGFWFVTVNRSRSDGLSGLTGLFVRGRVRREVRDGTLATLRTTKQRLEARERPQRP